MTSTRLYMHDPIHRQPQDDISPERFPLDENTSEHLLWSSSRSFFTPNGFQLPLQLSKAQKYLNDPNDSQECRFEYQTTQYALLSKFNRNRETHHQFLDIFNTKMFQMKRKKEQQQQQQKRYRSSGDSKQTAVVMNVRSSVDPPSHHHPSIQLCYRWIKELLERPANKVQDTSDRHDVHDPLFLLLQPDSELLPTFRPLSWLSYSGFPMPRSFSIHTPHYHSTGDNSPLLEKSSQIPLALISPNGFVSTRQAIYPLSNRLIS